MLPNHRRCVSCRKVAPKTDFWRVVRGCSTRAIQLDQGVGRSAYLCPTAECLQLAQKKDRLGRSLKVPVPKEVYQTFWQRLSSPELTIAPTELTPAELTPDLPAQLQGQKLDWERDTT